MRHPRFYDLAAAALAGGLSLFELIRLVLTHGVTGGITLLGAALGSGVFCVVLALAAIGLALHHRLGWVFGVLGFLTAAGYGIAVRASGSWVGVAYMIGAGVMLALMIKSLHWYRTPLPSEV